MSTIIIKYKSYEKQQLNSIYIPIKHFLQLLRESFVQRAKEDHEMIRGAQNNKLPMSTTCKINDYFNYLFKFLEFNLSYTYWSRYGARYILFFDTPIQSMIYVLASALLSAKPKMDCGSRNPQTLSLPNSIDTLFKNLKHNEIHVRKCNTFEN